MISTPDGEVVDEAAEPIGEATNNVAEYARCCSASSGRASSGYRGGNGQRLGIGREQIQGAYKVKHAGLRPLHDQAMEALSGFERWSVRSVPRAQNAHADALVNPALDAQG